MLRFKDNPPRMPASAATVADLKGTWSVVHTKPRCEKALASDLIVDGVGYYLPLMEKTVVSGGRKRRLMMPLFPSYVFICGGDEARLAAFQTGRVVQLIPVLDQARLVSELTSIDKAITGHGKLDLYPFAAVGNKCRVRSGPLVGIEGTVAERNRQQVLVLQVSLLGSGVALEIDPGLLEPAD